MTPDEYKPLQARIEAWWPGSSWDEQSIALWFEDLQRFDAVDVEVALQQLKRSHLSPFAPGLGQLLAVLEQDAASDDPTLDELVGVLGRCARREPYRRDSQTGRYPPSIALGVEIEMGVFAAGFVRVVGPERILDADLSPGSFARRDLQAVWDQRLAAFKERELHGRAVAAIEGHPVGAPAPGLKGALRGIAERHAPPTVG